ncbi:MAG: hypothetical protein AAF744_08430 [Pseudomonadota bacterium]
MGAAYALVAVLEFLFWVFFWVLAVGVPLLILWRVWRNRGRRRLAWLAVGVFWALPTLVEMGRDLHLHRWIAALPPAPVVVMAKGSTIALADSVFDAEDGFIHFAACPERDWEPPLCQFGLGVGETLSGFTLAFGATDRGFESLTWARQDTCDVHLQYHQQPESFTAFFSSQSICPLTDPINDAAVDYRVAYTHGTIPGFGAAPFGQLTLTEAQSGRVLTTLTSFALERPAYPVLWGLHWAPMLQPVLPRRSAILRHGETYVEAEHLGYPEGSLQDMAYAIGWNNQQWRWGDDYAVMEARFGFDADRALPALRSGSFFPTRFAIETLCHGRFRERLSVQAKFQIMRIAALERDISNGYPNRLAKEALENGCVTPE